nr:ribonuclease H-like domain-containing protein [Tanacetum cinerariifolium]
MLDKTFNRLQKLVSQLEILGEKILQEDVNQKLLRSLLLDWNTHVVVWRNKADLDTMSMDDLYNNLKEYEPKVKGMSSSSSGTQNMAFVSSSNNNTSSTNGAVNTAQAVNTANRAEEGANYALMACSSSSSHLKTGNFIPLTPDLSFTGLDKFVNKPVVENYKAKSSKEEPKVVSKNDDALIIKEWVSNNKLKAVVNDVKGNNSNVVKASACWVWKRKNKVLDHVSNHNNASITLKKFDYINAQGRSKVLELEKTKKSQHNEIASLKKRVKKLKKRNKSRTHKLKRLYKVGLTARVESLDNEESLGEDASKQRRIEAIDADEDITLVNDQDDADKDMVDVNVLGGKEVFAAAGQNENVVNITTEELTLAQALEALKTSKPKSHDKGKGIITEEPVKPKKKDQIRLNEEAAKRLQAQEQEELFDAKKATLFQQLLEKRRKHFAAKRAKEKRNKPPTKAQQRKIICTYLKNMEGYKLNNLKLKEFDSIKEMFQRAFRRENIFVDYRT